MRTLEDARMARSNLWIAFLSASVLIGCNSAKLDTPAAPHQSESAGPAPVQASLPGDASFAAAVTETGSEEQQPPPDRTLSGLATSKLRLEVQRRWNDIAFVSPAGKPLAYSAVLETELGPIEIALRPEIAPNHVRNFVALARAGYYNGLLFENVVSESEANGTKVEWIEGGCPLGTGETGIGHLGYWLKPEFRDDVKHEAGTVGACRCDQPDTAACRFYITLSPVPMMDGNFTIFGQVTHGLDVVRKISEQPRTAGATRPDRPTVIRSATIQVREVAP
jgi:cyclophilin family peptidyl-prolyl cis-trans isomerase